MLVRDAEDHISWLLQHGWHEKALAAVEAGQGRSELLDEVSLKLLLWFYRKRGNLTCVDLPTSLLSFCLGLIIQIAELPVG